MDNYFYNIFNYLEFKLELSFLCRIFILSLLCYDMKSFKIPKGQSEYVYRRGTDNTMAKRKCTKDKQRFTKHTYKTKDQVTRTPLKQDVNSFGNMLSVLKT